ncbi:hypothetical protein SAMN06297229_0683 [Pseudidiomarina planktonica]|uniref:Uncharacterized protein n=1 Tax=Pseudidiomarina planktonica TaxID=1323738 RepID=A0A1Y6EI26_9GAMM|nr:hypothetical protein [Pseudidiomarina planktonica]SMQ62265.1 hypothetical protein SAMN06297229_0683 [Pseudidiomarina planktonica]
MTQIAFKIAYWLLSRGPIASSRKLGGIDLKSYSHPKHHQSCLVIGNGPSLKNDLNTLTERAHSSDFVTVNHFSEDPLFASLKPTKHVVIDSYFWAPDAAEELKQKREKFYASLTQVDWSMTLYAPSTADQTFVRNMVSNPNIKLVFFGGCPVTRIPLKIPTSITTELYETSDLIPPVCNVLIYATFIAVLTGYSEIDIYGADLSFHMDIQLNQQSNELLMSYTHYYGETELVPLRKNPQRTQPFSMHEMMSRTADTFYAHKSIYSIAKKRNIKIRNKSSFSLIDVYPRA